MRQQELAEAIRPVLEEEGFELVECGVSRTPRSQTFRVSIDCEGGVSIEGCARASRRIALVLDANPLLRGSYQLEVSSAGMHRPIRTAEHFRRFRGDPVLMELSDPTGRPRRIRGEIGPVEEDRVHIITHDGEEVVRIPEIVRANLNLDPWKKRAPAEPPEGTEAGLPAERAPGSSPASGQKTGTEGTDTREHGKHGGD